MRTCKKLNLICIFYDWHGSEAVCKHDWHNAWSYLVFNMRKFRTLCAILLLSFPLSVGRNAEVQKPLICQRGHFVVSGRLLLTNIWRYLGPCYTEEHMYLYIYYWHYNNTKLVKNKHPRAFKGLFYQIRKFSSFTHPRVVPNLYEFLYSGVNKDFEECFW